MSRISYLIIIVIIYLFYGGLFTKDNEDTNSSDEEHGDAGQVIRLTSTLIKEDFLSDFYIKGTHLVETNSIPKHQYYVWWNGIRTSPLDIDMSIYTSDKAILNIIIDDSMEFGTASIPVSTINSVNLNRPLIKVGFQ